MDDTFKLNGITFVWNREKARLNLAAHDITFEQAAEAFFDPFVRMVDATEPEEARDAIIGMDNRWNLLFVIHIAFEEDRIRVISARRASISERKYYED